MNDSGHRPGTAEPQPLDRSAPKGHARDSLTSARPSRRRPVTAGPGLPRRLVSLAEASEYLSVSDWSIRAMVWRGDLPHIRLGKRILIDSRDLEAWIDKSKVRGA